MARQFSLRTLLVGVSIVSVYSAILTHAPVLFGILAIPLGAGLLALWAKKAGSDLNTLNVAGVTLLLLTCVALLLPALQSPRESLLRNACLHNMHQIGLALASYHQQNGSYPPAYVADAHGNPLVSWRVLLLPYMDQRPLYDQWKLHRDEAWNGPHNVMLSQKELDIFRCPSNNGPLPDTSYVAIVGPGTIWPGATPVSNAQITDGPSNTLILVEVANSGINWMEPRDLDVRNLALGVNPAAGQGVSSNHPAVACVQFADGRVTFFDTTVTAQQLRAMATIAGGEKVIVP